MTDSDDEPVTLSSHALAALQEFYGERDTHADKFEKLKAVAEEQHDINQLPLSMEAFTEDWNESQFWYADETATLFARQLLNGMREDQVIAVVSAPSVFVALKNLLNAADTNSPKPKVYLLEHDQRFAVFPEFIFYDFQEPIKLPAHLKGAVDRIICDPPFLSQDCQTKTALTVRWMSRLSADVDNQFRIIVCTGERMEALVTKLYHSFGTHTTTYEPHHARGLSNEFYCYANFESDAWQFKGQGK